MYEHITAICGLCMILGCGAILINIVWPGSARKMIVNIWYVCIIVFVAINKPPT